jgi:hypothetical protein
MYPIRRIFTGCCASARLKEVKSSTASSQSFPFIAVLFFTAMDMPQRRADENQYFIERRVVERDDSTTGAVSDLIRVAGDSSFARNAFQQFGHPVAS